MRISKHIFVLLFFCLAIEFPIHATIGIPELNDSLTTWTGFSTQWAPSVKVKNMRIIGNNITLHTNKTLRDVRWTPQNTQELKQKISRWILGHENGKVTILAGNTDIETLITDCARGKHIVHGSCSGNCSDLMDRNIALYPSHGLYYNRDRDEWIWQRATLWTTVEDLYSFEYVRLIKKMLENAGATIYMPRADLNQSGPGISGMPQWTEGARYWLMNQGEDSTLWNLYDGNEYKDDMKCRALWINSINVPIDLCLALHTDGIDSGDDTTIVGTLAIYTAMDDDGNKRLQNGHDRETVNRNLADWIQTQVTNDLHVIAPEWTRRQLKEANYCESRVPVVPSLILELLSHKNMADMRYGLDPKFRFIASRAVYKGILRYLNGSGAIVQPLPIKELGIDANGLLRWIPTIDSIEPTATPTYYMVYIQANNGEWDIQQVENATQIQLELKPGVQYNYYVVAGNEGGLSFPSPTISAYLNEPSAHEQMVLIVDAFNDTYGPEWFADSTFAGIIPGTFACEDYFSCAYIGQQWNYTRASLWKDDDNCGWGACYRDHAGELTIGNTHDYAVLHGRVLRKLKISYVSCTQEMMASYKQEDTPEFDFSLIDYICGRNRQPLSEKTKQLLETHLNQNGRLLLSTDHFSTIEPKWAKKYLHASYYAEQATHSGRISTPHHRIYQLVMEPNTEQLFTCSPEGLKAENGASKMASYEDMRCPAAVGVEGTSLIYGFPLEAVQDFDKIYKHAIKWLLNLQ